MVSSYRSCLNSGLCPEWELDLRRAIKSIRSIIANLHDACSDDRQFNNAADDDARKEKP